jgi:hypothetical protein
VIRVEFATERVAELGGEFDELGVALPGIGIEQFLLLFFGEPRLAAVVFALAFLLISLTPVFEEVSEKFTHGREVVEEGVA